MLRGEPVVFDFAQI